MQTIKDCLQCGGELRPDPKTGIPTCIYCGRTYKHSVEDFSYEIQEIVHRRKFKEFIQAEDLCWELIKKQPECSEAYWQLLLSSLGVVYVSEDGKQKPTFFSCSYDEKQSILQNENYKKAVQYAQTKEDREFYERSGAELDSLLKDFFKLTARESSYDIFISFKHTEEAIVGDETRKIETADYEKAKEIYEALKGKYRVFFSPVSIGQDTGLFGEKYEPRILKALQTSQAMILLGSKREYLEAQWVENEWRRYQYFIQKGIKKKQSMILGYFRNMPALPSALKDVQLPSFDMFHNNYLETLKKELAFVKPRAKEQNELVEEDEEEVAPIAPPKKKKKVLPVILGTLGVAVAGVGIYAGIMFSQVNKAQKLIDALPADLQNYELYDEDIANAYKAYNDLSKQQQGMVKNADKLLTIMPQYNQYKVDKVITLSDGISVETVETSTTLQDTVALYNALTAEQKALLSSEAKTELENYVLVADVIGRIADINENLIDKYDTLGDAEKKYALIDEAYVSLVYNYHLVATFNETMTTYRSLSFIEVEGGYAVAAGEGITITGAMVIPENYKGSPIVSVAENGFENQKQMTEITVPESVKTIETGAFKGCNKLEKMTLPFTGKSEDAADFEGVFGYIFGYTTTQGSTASEPSTVFQNSPQGTVDAATWQYSCYNGDVYNSWYGTKYLLAYHYYIPVTLRNVTITGQDEVKVAAFNGCQNLVSVTYNTTLTGINEAAFQNCSSLSKFNSETEGCMDLSGEYSIVYEYAFANCKPITNIIIPEGMVEIREHAFENASITQLTVPNSVKVIEEGVLKGCNKLQKLSVPFTGKGEEAVDFEGVLGYIFGYKTEQKAGDSSDPTTTFQNVSHGEVSGATWQYSCYNGDVDNSWYGTKFLLAYHYYIPTTLKEVTITKETTVKTAAFNGCEKITTVCYDNPLTELNEAAFQNCSALTNFNTEKENCADLSGKQVAIGACAFKNCQLIKEVILVEGLATIEEYAFEKTSIVELIVPNSVKTIEIGALKSCNKLQKLSIPFVGKSEEAEAFEGVFGYIFGYKTEQKAGDSSDPTTTFQNVAYGEVSGATWQYSCYMGDIDNSWYGTKFLLAYHYYIPTSLQEVTITKQTTAPIAAFNGCTNLTKITFAQGLAGQGECAFQNCTATIV